MREIILASPGEALAITVQRDGQRVPLQVTPEAKPEGGQIGVITVEETISVGLEEAAVRSAILPARVVQLLVVGLTRIVTGQEEADLTGPIGIVKHGAKSVELGGVAGLLRFLGMLSAYLGGFNLLPIPALDGGRLMFLGYEAVARRKPNQAIEAHIHAVGLLMFLALMLVVSVFDIRGD